MAELVTLDAAKKQSTSDRPFRFLDLDKAIRLVVYDILESHPRNNFDREDRDTVPDSGDYEEDVKFEVTRKSLRLTCWKIAEEWTPGFFRSTTICLNIRDCWRTPASFRDVFLKYDREDSDRLKNVASGLRVFAKKLGDAVMTQYESVERLFKLRESAIRNIRRLEYDGSRDGLFCWMVRAENICPNMYKSDAKGLQDFGAIPKLRLETLNVIFCSDPPLVLDRSNYIIRSDLMKMHDTKRNRLYIGVFEEQMTSTILRGASVVRMFEREGIQLFFRCEKPSPSGGVEYPDKELDEFYLTDDFESTFDSTSESSDNDAATCNGDDDDDHLSDSDERDMSGCGEDLEGHISENESDSDVRSRVSDVSGRSNLSFSFVEEKVDAFIIPEGWGSDKGDDEVDVYPNRKRRFFEVEE